MIVMDGKGNLFDERRKEDRRMCKRRDVDANGKPDDGRRKKNSDRRKINLNEIKRNK